MEPINLEQIIKDIRKSTYVMNETAKNVISSSVKEPLPLLSETQGSDVDYIITHEPLKKFTIRCADILEKVDNTLSKGIVYADKKISEIREEYPTTNRFFDALGFIVTKETVLKKRWQKLLREPTPRKHGMGFDVNSRLQEAKAAV